MHSAVHAVSQRGSINHFILRGCLAIALVPALCPPSIAAEQASSLTDAISGGGISLALRSRFESVTIDEADTVDLLSLRSRLTFETKNYAGLSALLEMDDVTHGSRFEGGIGDPEGSEINQAYLAYGAAGTTIRYGRQRILLDNQRFVGGVGFRQNEQTYDAIVTTNNSLANTTFLVAQISNVNRIFGEADAAGDHEGNTTLFNAKYSGWAVAAISAYGYLLDNEDAAAMSSDTYGLRFAGKTGRFNYAAEFATQSAADENPTFYEAQYWLAETGAKLGAVTLTLGYEVLGTDGSNGRFITPLATLHAFQGWTDVFVGGGTGNVPGGIEDAYVKLGGEVSGINLLLKYHSFGADDSSANGGIDDYGSELGLEIAKSWTHYGLSLKYASYMADDFGVDTRKVWLTGTANF